MSSMKLNERLSREEAERTVAAVETAIAAGAPWPPVRLHGRSAIGEAAQAIGKSKEGMRNRLYRAWELYQLAPNGIPLATVSVSSTVRSKLRRAAKRDKAGSATVNHFAGAGKMVKSPPAPEAPRSEIRDSSFWRTRSAALQKALDEAERMAEALAGLRQTPVSPVEWAMPTQDKRGRAVAGLLTSDVHMGEVIAAEETSGINAFNPEICRARLRRYFAAACHVGARLMIDADVRGAVLAMAGDMISGDIHEELRVTNALTSHEQVAAVIEEYAAGIGHVLDAFGRVHVVSVPGNHSRVTHKPTAKLYSRASYDTLIAAMLSERFKGNDRVTFQFGADKDQVVNLFGFDHFITHGDKIGTKGGMGFAGPLLPIVRGAKKIEAQQASIGRKPDFIWHGHYHTTANAGNVLSNGSVPGYSEYASDLRAAVEPPQQWLAVLHSHWGMRERVPIQLEDPHRDKPRVSVRAA